MTASVAARNDDAGTRVSDSPTNSLRVGCAVTRGRREKSQQLPISRARRRHYRSAMLRILAESRAPKFRPGQLESVRPVAMGESALCGQA